MAKIRLLAMVWLTVAVMGCDEEAESEHESHGSSSGGPMVMCEDEERADAFALGLTKEGSVFSLSIGEATPAPPVRGDNAWTVSITDEAGVGVEGAMVQVSPWMPDHGHGSPVPVEISEVGGGDYLLDPLNLFMAGFWEVTVTVTDADDVSDEVIFGVCVE